MKTDIAIPMMDKAKMQKNMGNKSKNMSDDMRKIMQKHMGSK